jgi:hypothetical protein
MAVATSGVTRALRGRDASTLRGVAVRAPSSAPVPRVQRGAARTVCIAAGLEGGLEGGSSRDDAWEAAKRAAEDIKKRRPTTFNPLPSAAPKTGATDAELNHRYVDGGLQRDDALPLSLAYRYERLPQGDKACSALFTRFALLGSAETVRATDAPRRRPTVHHLR